MRKIVLMLALACAGMLAIQASAGQAAGKPTVIAFYGDSTIRGYKAHSGEQVAISTPQAFAESLAQPSSWIVRNEGADSSRVEHLLAGEDGKHPAWRTYLPSSGVDIIIVNHASKNGNPVQQYKADMRKLVRLARDNGKLVILMTPNPIAEGGLEAYVDAMRHLAIEEKLPLIDVFRFLKEHMRATGTTIADIVPDGYHPAEQVYVMIGRYAAQEFGKIKRTRVVRGKRRAG